MKQTCFAAPGLLLALVLGACSPVDRYGTEVRYSPAYRAYIYSPDTGSDDPAEDESVVVLRNPITQTKIRCREDLAPWMRVHQEAMKDELHDEAWAIASPLLMLPATAVAGLGVYVTMIGMTYALFPFEMARSDTGAEIYETALEDVERADWSEVRRKMELAIVKDDGVSLLEPALYYLGIAYAEQGEADRAREAFHAFIERSLAKDVKAYRNAERWLRWLDDPIEPCRSRKPVAIKW